MKAMYWTCRFFLSYQSNFVPDFPRFSRNASADFYHLVQPSIILLQKVWSIFCCECKNLDLNENYTGNGVLCGFPKRHHHRHSRNTSKKNIITLWSTADRYFIVLNAQLCKVYPDNKKVYPHFLPIVLWFTILQIDFLYNFSCTLHNFFFYFHYSINSHVINHFWKKKCNANLSTIH